MKTRWNKKRVAGLLVCWLVYALSVLIIAGQTERVALCGVVILSVLTSLLAIYCAWKPLKVITLILCTSLFVAQSQVHQEDSNLIPECAVAVIVIGTGVILFLGIKKLCKKLGPPNKNPNQPPASGTNHLAQFVGPSATVSLPPLSDDNVEAYDVSSYSFWNTDPNGQPYTVWFTCVIESSTNLSNWRTVGTINGWASSTTIAMVISDENDRPISTNFVARTASSVSGNLPALALDDDRKFFRVR